MTTAWDVASAEWVRRLTDEDIVAVTDPGTFERGSGYADGAMVTRVATLNRGRALVARVLGSGSESYQTIVSLESDPADACPEWRARCSCPVSADCKHSVAVLLSVRESLGGVEAPPDAPATWETALADLVVDDAGAEIDLRAGAPLGLVLEPVGTGTGARLHVRPTRRTRAGHWQRRYSWDEATSRTGHTAARVSHQAAVERLVRLHRLSDPRAYLGPARGADPIELDGLGPEVWPVLRQAREAGVALLDGPGGEAVSLRDEPVEVTLDVRREDGGLRLVPVLGGTDGHVQLVGDPAHGVALVGDDGLELAPFATPLEPPVARLVHDGGIRVPGADADRFLSLYLPRLRERITVASVDGSVDLPEPSPPRLHVHVRGQGRGLRLDLGFAYAAGQDAHVVPAGAGGDLPRDAKGEHALVARMDALDAVPGARSRAVGSTRWRLRSPLTLRGAVAIHVVTDVLPILEADPDVVLVVDDDVPAYEEVDAEPEVTIRPAGETGHPDWLDLGITVTVGEVEVPFEPLFQALVRGEEIMELSSGAWFRLDHPVLAELRTLIEEARSLAEPDAGQLRLSRYQVDLWDDLSALGDVDIERGHAWRAGVEALRDLDTRALPAPPDGLAATLRPYQLEGYRWLSTLWDAGLGGVLADDMGLGKTVQTLALLARAAEAGELDQPVLVVAPTSVVGTWADEAARFVPGLDVRTLGQTRRRRGSTVAEAVAGAQLAITSYAVLRIDADDFADVEWRGVIIDEAQFVKNSRARTHHAVRGLSAPFVLAVTGTPLENSLMDLWSLLALAAPGLYPRRDRFTEVYRKPIESGEQPELLDRLRRRIRPLMLRRTKEQVSLDLPPKQVQVLPVDLTPGHRRTYDRHLQRERKRVLGLLDDPDANRVAILASLTRLRQLSLDPALVDDGAEQGTSAKVALLVDHLRELAGEGHRALVFSQFTGFLGLVRDRLTDAGVSTCYLDGATRERAEVIDEFRSGDATAFLISLKAGGAGLTLTEADYVFVLDPWWNPAAESQAIDRAHRIGQDRPVMVYRLVSTGTIEEKVLALQERKRDLFERVVDDGGALSGQVTAEDIRALLDTA